MDTLHSKIHGLRPVSGSAFSSAPKYGHKLFDMAEKMGLIRTIVGHEAGYSQAGDILTTTADGFDLNTIWTEFQAAIAEMNATRSKIVDLLTFPVTNPTERVPQISSARFERASEYGEPVGIRPTGQYFTMGYDFNWYDLAARFTWQFLADAPASQVEAIGSSALEADNILVFEQVMAALFTPTNRLADINGAEVNVYALYNADGTVPPRYKSNTHTGTHTHYLSSGAAAVTFGDLDEMYEHLAHHGYSLENGVRHVLMVNRAEGKVIRTFRVATGATYDFIPSTGQPGVFLDASIQLFGATQPGSSFGGLNVIGQYGPILVIEDDAFPVGYMALVGTGGLASLQNPVGVREHSNASLRGLRLVKGPNPDYPLIDSFYNRGFGTGIRHRGGSVVMKITAGAYTAPTSF